MTTDSRRLSILSAEEIDLILQLGYFKAKRQFFDYKQNAVPEDLRYIMTRYFPDRDFASIKTPSRPTRLAHQPNPNVS